MSFLNPIDKNKGGKLIRKQKCVYCKRIVRTCYDIPKCSRKDCKKLRKSV
jgi:hypothetical protein